MTVTRGRFVLMPSAVETFDRLSSTEQAMVRTVLDYITNRRGYLTRTEREYLFRGVPRLEKDGTGYGVLRIGVSLTASAKMLRRDGVFHVEVLAIGTPAIDQFASLVEQTWAGDGPDSSPRERGASARGAVGLAARIAGRGRSHLRGEWTAVLAGDPDQGITFSLSRQFLLALGFVLAAVRMRAHDVVRPAWRPVDWILRTESRMNGFITVVVGAQAIYIVDGGGLPALVSEVWEPCGAAGAALYVLLRWLRRRRGIELVTTERARPEE
ncbi:hypothetical protein [Streptomyces sviceus]|uniref:hypothetical protein n=1 Tax=Streptomyces sviceus TaxID=285530 RepID=UPI0036A3FCD4